LRVSGMDAMSKDISDEYIREFLAGLIPMYRKKYDLTIEEIGNYTGTSSTTILNIYKRKKPNISRRTLLKITKALISSIY
jgi:transcriptional regulator with XRE-family HTH domain